MTTPGRAHDYGEERRAVRRHLQVLGFPAPEREVYAALLTALRRPTLAAYFAAGGTVEGACRALDALRSALDAGLTLAQAAAEQAAYEERVEAVAHARHGSKLRTRAIRPGRRGAEGRQPPGEWPVRGCWCSNARRPPATR